MLFSMEKGKLSTKFGYFLHQICLSNFQHSICILCSNGQEKTKDQWTGIDANITNTRGLLYVLIEPVKSSWFNY